MSIVSSIVLLTFVSASVEPRLSTVENQMTRYGYKDFKQLEREEPTTERGDKEKQAQYAVWVNEKSIDGMAVAIVDGDRRSGKVRAYFEVHNIDTRAWDALVTCYEDPRCRRTRVVKNGLRDRRTYSVGGPADMFYGALAPRELGIPSRFGVSEPA